MATCTQLQQTFDRELARLDRVDPNTIEFQQVLNDLNTTSQELVAQGCIQISMPAGTWQIDASGFHGTLNLSFFGSFQSGLGLVIGVSGSAAIDAGFTDSISGSWNEDTQQLTFLRTIDHGVNVSQTYTGNLFGNPFGTEPPTIAGTFTTTDIPGRTFGWVMHQ